VRPTPRPVHVGIGDRVRLVRSAPTRPGATKGRVGKVHLIYWSQNAGSTRERPDPQWLARVEFAAVRRRAGDRPRVTYTVPVDAITCAGDVEGSRRRESELLEGIDRLLVDLRKLRDEVARLEEMVRVLERACGSAQTLATTRRRGR
jgi:hypothetical protein